MNSTVIIKKIVFLISFLFLLSCSGDDEPVFKERPEPEITSDAKVNIYGDKKSHTISPMIQGHGLSYSVEKDFIYETLRKNDWNRTATAAQMGIHPTTLWRKIKRLNLEIPKQDGRSKNK